MERSIYNIVDIVKEIHIATHEYPGKKKFQKLIYLVENIGKVHLGYEYEIHFYGPYSSKLDESVTKLTGEGFLRYHYEGSSHLICLEEENLDEDFFAPDLSQNEYATIKEIIRTFSSKSPSELELLTTTYYTFLSLKDNSQDHIIAGVQKIKGSKFSTTQIQKAIHELNIAYCLAV